MASAAMPGKLSRRGSHDVIKWAAPAGGGQTDVRNVIGSRLKRPPLCLNTVI